MLASEQGKKLGQRIIEALDHLAQAVGCYKAILDCSEKNQPFYEKCGYRLAGVQMVLPYQSQGVPGTERRMGANRATIGTVFRWQYAQRCPLQEGCMIRTQVVEMGVGDLVIYIGTRDTCDTPTNDSRGYNGYQK